MAESVPAFQDVITLGNALTSMIVLGGYGVIFVLLRASVAKAEQAMLKAEAVKDDLQAHIAGVTSAIIRDIADSRLRLDRLDDRQREYRDVQIRNVEGLKALRELLIKHINNDTQ